MSFSICVCSTCRSNFVASIVPTWSTVLVLVGLFIVLVGLFTVFVGLFIVLVGLFIVLVGLFTVKRHALWHPLCQPGPCAAACG